MIEDRNIATIMTEEVLVVHPSDTLEKVHKIFEHNIIHHIPVVNAEREVVGIISKSDYHLLCDHLTLFGRQWNLENNNRFFRSLLVEEVMTRQVAKLRKEDSIFLAAAFFRENLFHAIPIVDERDRLVGIVSTYDLLNYAYRDPVPAIEA
ncbi:MAG: CBS domain-containing protein [Saprospiraceae bacterium]|nr:CBS domain-containing protein [Saprospiraceae bacterium]